MIFERDLQLSTSTSAQQSNYLLKPTNYHRYRKIAGKPCKRNVARYLDPRTSRWMSADPAMYQGDYIPGAPVNDEARKRNGNLPGQGGVYNYVNMHVYHYAGNNPVKYTDPDGRAPRDEVPYQETQDNFHDWLATCDPKYNSVAPDVKKYIENQGTLGKRPTSEEITQEAENALKGQPIFGFAGGFATGGGGVLKVGKSVVGKILAKSSSSYKMPAGGGGISAIVKINGKKVTFGHGGRHLDGTGLDINKINREIAKVVSKNHPGIGQAKDGTITIDGIKIFYNSFGKDKNVINVGTYYTIK